MRAGELRHRITIEAPTGTQNEYGEPIEGWTPLATVWAAREDLNGREYFAAKEVQAEVTTRFRIRHRPDIEARQRILYDGTAYNISSVQDPEGRGRELVILAERDS